ncbi:MAG: DUF1501 domain-containing protein [Haliscomenobacteraceae bacterium CHB4]|nr:hypothetical protein [Saprospiraceae bacterium]MCE7922945.1 DUF1501 domain-containing protein [Haliscomenobacteraceae bacterium CHB4]
MKRRSFLKYSGAAAAWAGFQFKGFSINPAPQLPFLQALAAGGNPNDRILVLIQLNGGNDGLNTFIPLDQYDKLANLRSNVLIPENSVLSLTGTIVNGLHPAMTHLRDMYNNGLVSVVQNVGYPNQDYSHFRSTDIWMSASDSDQLLETGWAGRYLQSQHPAFPDGYPNPDNPDPLAIQIGSFVSLALMGNTVPMGMAISDPTAYYEFVNDIVEPAPDTPYGDELEFIRLVAQQAQVYYQSIKGAADVGQNLSALYPASGENYLADQLRIVAQLISGGLKTPIYIVSLDGFDTHSDQVDGNFSTTEGIHAELLRKVSEAIGAFQDDLKLLGVDERVAGFTFSEFGRTIASNASLGTDHGAAAPLFAFGKNVIPGIIGDNPQIPDNPFASADLPMQHDFRSVYASALQDWFGIANPESILNYQFPILPIFKAASSGSTVLDTARVHVSNFPNPFHHATTFTFTTDGGRVSIDLLDMSGRVLQTIVEGTYPAGTHRVTFSRSDLRPGHYFYSIKVNGATVTKKLLVI